MGGGWEHSCSEPCSLKRPSTSLAPHQAVSQNHAQKFPSSFSVLKLAAQTVLHSLWNFSCGLQSSHPLTAALSLRIWVYCPQSPRSSSGKQVPCYPDSWWSPEKHTYQESGFSVCPSEKPRSTVSAFPVTVELRHLQHIQVARQVSI